MTTTGPAPPLRKHKPRHLAKFSNYPVIGRSRLLAQFQKTTTELAATSRFPLLSAFLPQHLLAWVWNYLKSVFHGRYKPFPVYPAGTSGVFALQAANRGNVIKIAIAGDWGTGTVEAEAVAHSMKNANPDYTIHLGDVYYIGGKPEIEENCLGYAPYTGLRFAREMPGENLPAERISDEKSSEKDSSEEDEEYEDGEEKRAAATLCPSIFHHDAGGPAQARARSRNLSDRPHPGKPGAGSSGQGSVGDATGRRDWRPGQPGNSSFRRD